MELSLPRPLDSQVDQIVGAAPSEGDGAAETCPEICPEPRKSEVISGHILSPEMAC